MLNWVSPFRNLRFIGYLLLAAAYRSLSRLSSALSAKASTLRSYSLDFPPSFDDGLKFSESLRDIYSSYILKFFDLFEIFRCLVNK